MNARSGELHGESAIAAAAAAWVVRRDRGFTAEERRAFIAWRAADPRHAAELERLGVAWRGLDGLGAAPDLAAMADDVLATARARRARRRVGRFAGLFGAAAAAVAAGFFGWQEIGTGPAPGVRFPNGNYRVIASTVDERILPDGSRAQLNGSSRIETEFTAAERRVRLVDGEAHFVVIKDPARPFYVTAGAVTVRAVGTAFNVRLAAETVEVLVTEGKVQLQQERSKTPAAPVPPAAAAPGPALVQGQRAIVARATPAAESAVPAVEIGEVGKTEIEAALGWQSTRLVFSNTPLDEVVEGFNRYNTHRLTLGDPALRERALTGVFRADNLDGFVRLLKSSIDVKAEQRTPTETVLLPLR